MLKQRLFYLCLFILMSYFVTAQELRCNISVSSQKIQGTNRELFTNMQRDMYEFLNNKRWSENIFQYDERIECSIQITLDEQIGSDQFRGSMQVRVSRPVYKREANLPTTKRDIFLKPIQSEWKMMHLMLMTLLKRQIISNVSI